MDSITHLLAPALWTEPIPPPSPGGAVYARWRERAALAIAALLPDVDGVLGWIDPALYARYHRVFTHSAPGIVLVVLIAAWIARTWPERAMLPSLRTHAGGRPIVKPTFRRLLGFASISAAWHLAGDWVTAWGIQPLWPFWRVDMALGRVNSIEPVVLTITAAAWAVQHLFITRGKRRGAWVVAVVWIVVCAGYVWLRPMWGVPAFV